MATKLDLRFWALIANILLAISFSQRYDQKFEVENWRSNFISKMNL